MSKAAIAGAALVTVIVLVVAAAQRSADRAVQPPSPSVAITSADAAAENEHQGSLYGRLTTEDGASYIGLMRFGREEEAFWGNYFNGVKDRNPWAAEPAVAALVQRRRAFRIFRFEIPLEGPHLDLGRPFMARFGDIARIEAQGRDLRVLLKSGTVVDLDWGAANDFADGVRVWDEARGVVDLYSWAGALPPPARQRIRTIEFLGDAQVSATTRQLHGTVRTAHGSFTGFIQWNRRACVGADEIVGSTADGTLALRFDTIRSIARRSSDSALVTLVDGREVVLSGTRDVGEDNGGVYVDDPRYGRVLVSWDAFDRIEFSAGGSEPGYADFPPGHPLTGTVTTRAGHYLAGRLVYDLDESETTETLDAPSRGVDYTIPFGLVASIVPDAGEGSEGRRARVTLHDGETLLLDRAGDLGDRHGGLLIFVEGSEHSEYVPWSDVHTIDFHRPPLMYPPLRRR